MSETRNEVQVGIALVAALFVLVFGLMWFEERQLGEDARTVHVRFETIGGLGVGDPVFVRGMKMGTVRDVELADDAVELELNLRREVRLTEDALFRVGSAGIMGERMVYIVPGTGEPVADDHVFVGAYEAAVTDLVGQMEEFSGSVMALVTRADSLLVGLQEDDRLARAVQGAAEATGTLGDIMAENRDDLRMAAANMAQLTTRLDRFFDEHEEDLASGAAGMARASTALDTLTVQLADVLGDTRHILTALRDQKGPAGRMIYDEQAGENLVQTLEKLRFLVEDIQRNPERYLTVKIF